MPLPSSFWLDETVTAFVVRYGPDHPSLSVAKQAWQSIYYFVPRAADALFGFSEISYRVPSVLAMAIALWLIARLASRLVHPQAGWFAVFACLGLRGLNYEAADARPYALGICIAAASVTFLVRWLDSTNLRDAVFFFVFAALLWRVHLLFWPFYLVFILYAMLRLVRRETSVPWMQAGAIFALLAIALVPVLTDALSLYRDVEAHVIVPKPSLRDLASALKFGLILPCFAGAWLLHRVLRWPRPATAWTPAALALVAGWWLCQPICLFAFSWLTGNSLFVPRYLSLSLPGVALAATAAAAPFLPSTYWKPAAAAVAVGVLLYLGDWRTLWPPHHNSDWRAAAAKTNELVLEPNTPVICPSPFIEARTPLWQPDYPLPGFLYAHLPIYPIRGKAYLFPFETSLEAEQYATALSSKALSASGRFILYGWHPNVQFWREWFAARPEFAGWRVTAFGPFRDVDVVLFEKGLSR